MEIVRWTTALLLALFAHIGGLLWIEPGSKSIVQPDTLSESIVVILGQGNGEAAQTAQLLNVPGQTPVIEPVDTSSDQTPVRVHERLAADAENVVDDVAAPPLKRSSVDLDAIDTLDAKIVEKQAPSGETVRSQALVAAEPRLATEDEETDAAEIPIASTLAAKDPVMQAPALPTTRAESQSAEVAERVAASLLADDGDVKVTVSTPIPTQTEESEVEVVEMDTTIELVEKGDEIEASRPTPVPPAKPSNETIVAMETDTTTDVIEKGDEIEVSRPTPVPPAKPSNETVEVMEIDTTTDVIEKEDEIAVSSPMPEPPAKLSDEVVEVVTTGPAVVAAREAIESQPVSTENRGSDVGAFEISVPAAVEEPPDVDVSTPVAEPVRGPETTSTVMPGPSSKSPIAAETGAAVETTPQVAAVLSLDTVVTVDDRGAVAVPPGPDEVAVVETPPGSQVARAVTLNELMGRSPGGKGVVARYAGLLKGWLQENMHYPRAARLAGQEGVAIVRFVIDRNGMVRSIQLEQESGHRILDREAVEMIERAEPFPVMPADMAGGELELRVPVSFHITDGSLNKNIPPIYLE